MSVTITTDEWRAELERVMLAQQAQTAGGASMKELRAQFNINKDALDRFLDVLEAEGRLIVTHEKRRARDHVMRLVSCYQIKPASS